MEMEAELRAMQLEARGPTDARSAGKLGEGRAVDSPQSPQQEPALDFGLVAPSTMTESISVVKQP
jgi:hypothetical protein